MRTVRRLLAASCTALLISACTPNGFGPDVVQLTAAPSDAPGDAGEGDTSDGGQSDGGTGDTGGESGGGDAGQPDDGGAAGGDTSGEGSGSGSGGQSGGGTTDEPAEQPPAEPAPQGVTPANESGPVGAMGPAYLRGDRPSVVLEIDVQAGVALSDSVISHISGILARESNADVKVQRGPATGTKRDTWTNAQLRAAAAESRDVRTGDKVAVMQLLVLDGAYEKDGVLGLAFDASSAAVFPDQWSDLATVLLSGQSIARAVSMHEVGHLLGLVGLVEAPTSNHEDPEHPGHTTDQNDVMYWAVETTLIGSLSGVPDDFGPKTRADLAALRDG